MVWSLISSYRLPSYGDSRYGIHLKKTDEFGIYSFFVHDDGKTSSSYGRLDPMPSEQRVLL